jgi:5-aminopentanamidase
MKPTKLRAGIFQCQGGGLTPDQRLVRLSAALDGQNLALVVCPELFLSGYNVGNDLKSLSQPNTGPWARRITDIAQQSGTAIVYGYPERHENHVYNSAACISPTGELLANHRKLILPPGMEADYFSPGHRLTTFELNGLRFAILICYDAEFPETVRAVAEHNSDDGGGVDAVLVPTALVDNWASVAHQLMPTRAFENGIWLLYANHAGSENDANYLGASCIVSPDGKDAARAGSGEELIIAEIDRQGVEVAQARLPYLGEVGRLRATLQ